MSKIHIYGDNIDTDVIIPARYLNVHDEKELAKYCMEDIDPEFVNKVKEHDIMVGGYNFGCGSSREHAPIAIKASGIKCVVAKSFARKFFRNAINIGLPVIESECIASELSEGDVTEIDFDLGIFKNVTKDKIYDIPKFPDFMKAVIEAGGLINYTKNMVGGINGL